MNKCLSLVHLTTNFSCGKTTDKRLLLGYRRVLSEMNKCLSLVHLTTNSLRGKTTDKRLCWAAAEFL